MVRPIDWAGSGVVCLLADFRYRPAFGPGRVFGTFHKKRMVPEPVIWHVWWLHFGTLGDHGTIEEHMRAQESKLLDLGLDFLRFVIDFGSPF